VDKVLSGKEKGVIFPETGGKGRAIIKLVTVGRHHEGVPWVASVGEEDQAHRVG
jgi:hypothetical protein